MYKEPYKPSQAYLDMRENLNKEVKVFSKTIPKSLQFRYENWRCKKVVDGKDTYYNIQIRHMELSHIQSALKLIDNLPLATSMFSGKSKQEWSDILKMEIVYRNKETNTLFANLYSPQYKTEVHQIHTKRRGVNVVVNHTIYTKIDKKVKFSQIIRENLETTNKQLQIN